MANSAVPTFIRTRQKPPLSVADFGAIGDGTSHLLSETYGTLGAAQADYPAAIALTDEKDWCAWQAASDYIYTRDDTHASNNWSAGRIIADGQYMVNRSVVFNHAAIFIEGATPGQRVSWKSASTITYNGPNGTIDAPIPIFDFYLFDEFAVPPPGRKGNSTASGGTKVEVKSILFNGKGGNMLGSFDASGYVSGIRLRKGSFVKIFNCIFGEALYDGISVTDAQLFFEARGNYFYGVHRDAIAFQAAANFSTTVWLYNNEFGYVGRYAILCDMMGSVEPFPIVRDNSFEHGYQSYFVLNPEWFVQGLVASTCFINAGNLLFEGNRFEGPTDSVPKFWADVHLIACGDAVIQNGCARNIAVAARSQSALRTSAADAYLAANSHLDITNERNYNCGVLGDYNQPCGQLTVRKIYNLDKILSVGDCGLSSSARHRLEEVSATILSIPTTAGAFATIAQPRNTAIPVIATPTGNLVITSASITDAEGVRTYGNFFQKTGTGDYSIRAGPAMFGQWAALTAYIVTMPTLGLSSVRAPLTENGFFYQAIVAGTSAASEPTWPTIIGDTVVDGTVTWKCVGRCAYTAEDSIAEWQCNGQRNRVQAAPPTVSPSWIGDQIWFPSPVAGGYRGKVCTNSGTPGTWKGFGLIEA